MSNFEASQYSYGADAATPATQDTVDKITGFLKSAAPALSIAQELVGKTDREKVAILKAKVANYKRLMNTPPYSVIPGTAWYTSEITKMKAQIRALGASVAEEADTTQDYSIWRKLTSVGGVVGIGVGVGVIYFLVKKANK